MDPMEGEIDGQKKKGRSSWRGSSRAGQRTRASQRSSWRATQKDTRKDREWEGHKGRERSLFRSISQAFAQKGPTDLGIKEINISRAGLLSLAFYSWMTPLVYQLCKRGVGSILNLQWMQEDTAETNVQRLERAWKEELNKQGPIKARLGRAICSAYRKRLTYSIITILTCLIVSFVSSAFLLRSLLKCVADEESPLWLSITIVCLLVLCEMVRSLTFSLAWCFNYWTGMRVRLGAMGLLYKKMLRLRSLRDKKIGELVNMCSNDGQRLYEALANAPFIIGGPVIFVVGSIYLVVLMGPWALVGIATFVCLFVIMKFVASGLEYYRLEAVTLTGERVALMTEVVTCMKLIKMNAWEPSFMDRITKKRKEEQMALEKAFFLQSIITSLVPMVPVIASVSMFIAYILVGNDLDESEAFTVISVLYAISFAMAIMIHGIRTVADANVACLRFKEVLQMDEVTPFPDDMDDDNAVLQMTNASFAFEAEEEMPIEPTDEDSVVAGITAEDFDGINTFSTHRNSSVFSGLTIEVPTATDMDRGLLGRAAPEMSSFKLDVPTADMDGGLLGSGPKSAEQRESQMDLLENSQDYQALPQLINLNITINKGELIGICGMKGSGKSAFLVAILGRMQLLSGSVKVTGRIAYAGQEPWVFNGTARDNITFGQPYIKEKFDKVVNACSLDKDFDTFGAGDKVEIGDRGLTLSGGQKQRICLARALYSDSDIFLLDDPLSALDIHIGRHVFAQCLKIFLKSKTVLFVTHHLEYLPMCDRVMLMHEGSVVEMGAHNTLLGSSSGPMYTELYQLYQSKYEKIQRHRLLSSKAGTQDGEELELARNVSRLNLKQPIEMLMGRRLSVLGPGKSAPQFRLNLCQPSSLHLAQPSAVNVLGQASSRRQLSSVRLLDQRSTMNVLGQASSRRQLSSVRLLDQRSTMNVLGQASSRRQLSSVHLLDQRSTMNASRFNLGISLSPAVHPLGTQNTVMEVLPHKMPPESARMQSPESSGSEVIGAKVPQRGFSRLSMHQLSRHLSRMSTNSGFQHQFSIMSTPSGIFGDYEFVDVEDLMESGEMYETTVSWSVYGHYIRAMGGYAVLIFMLVCFAISIGIQSVTTWFLSYWLNQGNGTVVPAPANSSLAPANVGSVVDNPLVDTYTLIYGLFLIGMLVIMVFRSAIFVKVLLRASSNLHQHLLKRTMTCPMKFFDTTPLGIILNRFSADIDEIDVRLPSNMELYLQNVFLVLSALAIICYAFPWDLVVVVPLAVAFVAMALVFAPLMQQLKFVDSITRSPYLSHLASSMEGMLTIHTFGQSERFFQQFYEMLDRNNIPFFLFYMANRWLAVFLDLMIVMVIAVTGFLTIFSVSTHKTSEAGLALSFAIQVTSLLQYTLRLTIETGSRFSSVHRVQEYIENLQTEGAIASSSSEVPSDWPSQGAITFNKYCMRYNDSLPPAVKSVTIAIKPMEKIGIVGNSGSGKSSLGVGLFRLSEAASGAIYIDDHNIRDVKLSALRSRISILVQDPVLFEGTIRYNLDPPGNYKDDADLWQMLDKCHMKETMESLDKQLDTMVEENGRNFSMGERQLLCLARTLLRKCKILVLDEATASVDTRTDFLVQQTIRDCCKDNTVLTIAHRINTIWDCDKVLVMERGRAVEYSSPQSLLQKPHSKFKAMYDTMKTRPRGGSIDEEDEADSPLTVT